MATDDLAEPRQPAEAAAVAGDAATAARPLLGGVRVWVSGVREINLVLALVGLIALFSFSSPYFLTTDNLLTISRAFSMTAIIAIGQTMVIITGGIDLSVGSVLALSGLSTGMLLGRGWPLLPAVAVGLLVGTATGMVNGLLITRIGLPPFIATLGMLSIGRGLVYVLTKGYPVSIPRDQELLKELGQGYVGPVPVPVIIMLVVTVLGTIFLSQSTLGRYVYAVGGNEEAARLAGINVALVKLFVYTMTGLLSALAGMILLARLVSAQPSAGLGFELPVIAAAIIGGTSLAGGEGTVLRAVLGAANMGVPESGMVFAGVNTYAQQAVTGGVIILAISLDPRQKRRRQRV